jgi:hypothetical protein
VLILTSLLGISVHTDVRSAVKIVESRDSRLSRRRVFRLWTSGIWCRAPTTWYSEDVGRKLLRNVGVNPKDHNLRRIVVSDRMYYVYKILSLSVMLRSTVSRPVCLGIKHPSGAYDQIFIIVWQLRVCCFGAPSLTRGRVCRLQLLLALASAVFLGSESLGTRDHILLFQIRDFPFRRLLRLAGSRWRYSIPPPHGVV